VGGLTYYVRSTVPPETLGPRVRQVVQRIDSTLRVTDLKTMSTQIRESASPAATGSRPAGRNLPERQADASAR